MAEKQEVEQEHDPEEGAPGYKPPAEKSVNDILAADAEDESLRKYKESLGLTGSFIVFPDNPNQVIVRKLTLVVEGRDDTELDLTNLDAIEKKSFIIKEGCHYKLKISFYAQREIVAGLKYVQKLTRKGIQVGKDGYMLGSYPPKIDLQHYSTPLEEAPSGMLARGTYNVKSYFIDDDKKEHVKWEWKLEIKKDWQ